MQCALDVPASVLFTVCQQGSATLSLSRYLSPSIGSGHAHLWNLELICTRNILLVVTVLRELP